MTLTFLNSSLLRIKLKEIIHLFKKKMVVFLEHLCCCWHKLKNKQLNFMVTFSFPKKCYLVWEFFHMCWFVALTSANSVLISDLLCKSFITRTGTVKSEECHFSVEEKKKEKRNCHERLNKNDAVHFQSIWFSFKMFSSSLLWWFVIKNVKEWSVRSSLTLLLSMLYRRSRRPATPSSVLEVVMWP